MSRFVFIILFLFALQPASLPAAPTADSQVTKRVLVLYSLDKGHPAHGLTEQGISEALQANQQFAVQLYSEYLDMGRFPDPGQARAMAAFLRSKYKDLKIDVIIAVYPSAVDFLQGEGRNTFPGVPIIAGEISRSYAASIEKSPVRQRITGTIMGDNISGVLDAALRLKPVTKRVALIAGVSPLDVYNEQLFRAGLKSYPVKLELIEMTRLTMADTLTRVGSLPEDTIVLYASIIMDGAGRKFAPREPLALINRATSVPVFSLYNSYFGHGIVGGRLVSMELQGKPAAALALRVMAGESPAAIPFSGEDAYVDLYDWRELRRWQIPAAAIPAGSEIRFQQMTFWEEHRWVIVGAISLAIIETFLILVLIKNIMRRKVTEQLLRKSEQNLRNLSGRLISAQEEERRRIARELHDDVTQRLALLAIDMGKLERQSAADPDKVKDQFAAMRNSIVKLSEDIHAISRQLHPAVLDDLGLVRAIQSECVAFSQREGIEVTFRQADVPETIPRDISLALYRIMQESFRNISRHSRAKNADISLACCDNVLQLAINDAGVGFEPGQARNQASLGLVSMAERVNLVNGTISVASVPGEGTAIDVRVPLEVSGS